MDAHRNGRGERETEGGKKREGRGEKVAIQREKQTQEGNREQAYTTKDNRRKN